MSVFFITSLLFVACGIAVVCFKERYHTSTYDKYSTRKVYNYKRKRRTDEQWKHKRSVIIMAGMRNVMNEVGVPNYYLQLVLYS